jgi:23S rRNA (cytosine1962-C5)-methyltransferase
MKELVLPDSLATSLASGHPWVYRDHVGRFTAPAGSVVLVKSGSFSAYGIWDDESAIALRIYSTKRPPDDAWFEERVREAWLLRASLRDQGVTGYRLIFGEADALPGIVVDLYGEFAVLVTYSKSLGALAARLGPVVARVTGCRGVVRRFKSDEGVELRPLFGEMPPEVLYVEEHGMKLLARSRSGQKTGLFFDHRENRAYVKRAARGCRVLNLYSYTGGFSVAAALGGAKSVTSVDIAAPAILDAEENFRLNGLAEFPHRAVAQDVIAFLEGAKKSGEKYDLIVCDPPSFAKNRTQLRAAEKAYRRVMGEALGVVSPGGLFCAASCTSQIGPEAFRHALCDAARKARVRFQIVHDIGQPSDHPVLVGHEEGRYLKFIVGRVLERC